MGINSNSKDRQLNYHVTENVAMCGNANEDVRQAVQNVPSGVRKIIVHKRKGRLGFNIVGGEDGLGIYISSILPGWLPSWLSLSFFPFSA